MEQPWARLPKLDLHCHLDGSLSPALLRELLSEEGETLDERALRAPDDCPSLADYLKCFSLPLRCLQTRDHLRRAALSLAMDAAAENVKYLEVRFAPTSSTQRGLSLREVLESVRQGHAEAEARSGIRTGMIVCAMRHLPEEENRAMLRAARELLGDGVAACDLAGNERAFPNAQFSGLFSLAAELEFPFTIHSGECGSAQNVRDAVAMGARRLGHGIAMAGDPETMRLCAARGIGVELCPTSNFQTKAVRAWSEYPLRAFLRAGVPVSVNTDNRTVSSTSETQELQLAARFCGLTGEELHTIYQDSVRMAFADDACKDRLLKEWSV